MTAEMTTYRLGSSPAIMTPGFIAWAINGYAFEDDREQLLDTVSGGWPSIPREALDQLLSKKVPYQIDGETVVFTA